ncbi:MAG: alpha/beta hydrolase [Acidobacteriia bacterium]|nr:alpha/beta hydrolase [Terriglobia bacterium]
MQIYKSLEGRRAVEERYRAFLKRWPVPNEQLRIPTREGETFVVASGPESAPPVLLFHGAGTNSAMWMGDVTTWSAHFRVYAVDLIGEPGLSAPSRPLLNSETHALWLDDLLQGLSLTRASLLGASLGGWLALDYAIRRPERVVALALLCPAGVGQRRASFLIKVLPLQLLGEWGRGKAYQIALGPLPASPSPGYKPFAEFAALIQRNFRPRRTRLPIFSDEALRRLNMPVLAIVGGQDAILDSYGTKRRLEKAALGASVCLLPECGHLLPGQNSRILDFLTEALRRQQQEVVG